MEMKIFVWTGFQPDYTDGLAFAIARTEKEARDKIIKKRIEQLNARFPSRRHTEDDVLLGEWGELHVYEPTDENVAFFVLGGA